MKKQLILSTFLYFSMISLQHLIAQSQESSAVPDFDENEMFEEELELEERALSLKTIDKIIKQKDYNTALAELAIYMKVHPNDFDRAQKRVAKIMKSRWKYNEQAQKLAEAMKNDSNNTEEYDATDVINYSDTDKASDQEKLDIIMTLENQEQNQTSAAEELTRQARKALALRFYISRYNKIMEDGYRLLKEEKYKEAISKFQEGFKLKPSDSDKIYNTQYPDGLPVTYASDITKPVNDYLDNITNLVPQIEVLRLDCEDAYKAFMTAVRNKDYNAAVKANTRVQSTFKRYATLRNRILQEVIALERIDKIANKRNPELKGFSYITFTLGFITGDKDILETGVLGTMDSYWNSRIENMKGSLYELTHSDLSKIKDALPDDKIRTLRELIETQKLNTRSSVNFPTIGDDIQALNNEILLENGTRLCQDFKEYNKSMSFIEKFAVSMNNVLEGARLLADDDLKQFAEDVEDGNFIASDEFLESHLNAAVRYEEIMNQSLMESYIADELRKEREYFRNKEIVENPDLYSPFEISDAMTKYKKPEKTPGAQLEDAVLDYRDVIEYQQKIAQMNFDESQGKTLSLWGGLATLFATNAEDTVDEYEILFDRADVLLKGLSEKNDENDEFVRKYPRESKEIADKIIKEVTEKHKNFTDWRKSLGKGEKYRKELPAYDNGTNNLDKAIKDLEDLLARSRKVSNQADIQVKASERAMDEANQNYARALESLEKKNFTNARNYLNKASQKYAESFNIQEDRKERAEKDKLISELSARIIREENELVIAEVRELINEAQDSYYDGNLDYAEKRLIMAQNRWSVTNTEKNEEIESLLELVSTARTLQIGRKIKTTDPLYSDMSQLLSVANQFYEEGKDLMKNGKKEEAVNSLNLAREKLEPMKLIYPLNDDAAFLRLKIEKELDPESFNAGFKRRVDEANTKKPAEKLASLENLLKINPSYPGLAKQVENLQYDLGIKTRPTAASGSKNASQVNAEEENRRRAQNLYSQASSIFNAAGNNQNQLRQASNLLDEIIRIYSRDRRNSIFRQATLLKDRIQSRIGGTVVAVLTADDEANFQRAQNFVNRGNYDAANDILEKLWRNPAAQKTKKIIDLRTFVKNRL